jgi:hypothetical protein
MRQLIGVGTPRGLQGRLITVITTLLALIKSLWLCVRRYRRAGERVSPIERRLITNSIVDTSPSGKHGFHHGLLVLLCYFLISTSLSLSIHFM